MEKGRYNSRIGSDASLKESKKSVEENLGITIQGNNMKKTEFIKWVNEPKVIIITGYRERVLPETWLLLACNNYGAPTGKPFGEITKKTDELNRPWYWSAYDCCGGRSETLEIAKTNVERYIKCYPTKGSEPGLGRYSMTRPNDDSIKIFFMTIGVFENVFVSGQMRHESGYGFPVKDNLVDSGCKITIDNWQSMPHDATHFLWYGGEPYGY